ncbi:hypothetical protein, partial [Rhizobium leguminosarum]|uniref:hypothetical protein n=1 Tax=Rhizobium leguminosarum TaxID=384 RepID=UPI003F9562CB
LVRTGDRLPLRVKCAPETSNPSRQLTALRRAVREIASGKHASKRADGFGRIACQSDRFVVAPDFGGIDIDVDD